MGPGWSPRSGIGRLVAGSEVFSPYRVEVFSVCGIAGFWQRKGGSVGPEALRAMGQRIVHRGPDDQGHLLLTETGRSSREIFFDEEIPSIEGRVEVGLAHRRLSILDLDRRSRQPMGRDGIWMTYNGEVYNFRELRDELESKGEVFHTTGDTEVVLAAFRVWGERCFERFNGMFAIAIWEEPRRRLVLARDRLGIKPLVYHDDQEIFSFASESKALLALPNVPNELSLEGLDCYLSFLWVPDPLTMIEGIRRVRPGHYMVVDSSGVTETPYWSLHFQPREVSLEEACEGVRDQMDRSVRLRLASDVPLGMFLSGGIDSTAILASMCAAGQNPESYSVGFHAEDLSHEVVPDDMAYARVAAEHYGARNHEIFLQPDVSDLLPRVVWHLDDPVADPAAISTLLICRAARESLTVLLSGMGGDEVFAGYPRHLAHRVAEIYNHVPRWIRRGLVAPTVRSLPGSGPGRLATLGRNAQKFLRSAESSFEDRYLGFGTYFGISGKERLYRPEVRESLARHDAFSIHREHLAGGEGLDPIDRMLSLDLATFLPCLNLAYTDRLSMAVGAEVRVPFLDHELVEYAATLPPSFKLRGRTRKYVLKKAMEPRIPHSIIWRRKAGFGAPIRSWLAKDLAQGISDWISPSVLESRGLFRPEEVHQLQEDLRTGRKDTALQIWQILTLELWMRAYIDQRGEEPAN
ncbi:MAG: asparagine synthase (glutamine-hydrolyzing) [Planctomycetota bacterium]|nr:asparagine synthase (glutamine-hydrolyzing) [Planctomycetota bacterium]